ncbi:MAG: UDP-N-acetylmuramate dehydrogenase [Moorella sp. (in: Bacteria)]|nr:UDP-N-acetylmuramate dehydrogenase [Moorella sp. (in: firmicutes)]
MDLAAAARELQRGLQKRVLVKEPLARHTTWRIGGPADLFVRPATREELEFCLGYARQKGLPPYIMGNGSNLLVRDGGIRGLVIKTAAWHQVSFCEDGLEASAGALLARVLRGAARAGLGGLEFAAGIPATIGGAVVMNAGTPEGWLGDVVRRVEVIAPDGNLRHLERQEITFAYRSSSLRGEGVIAAVTLRLAPADPRAIQEKIATNLEWRRIRQPLEWPNAGSVFKNPPGYYAGQLIEQVGAKGWQAGRARVSARHANFIINLGGATAADVFLLINRIQEEVARRFGINLELEVEVWGEGL